MSDMKALRKYIEDNIELEIGDVDGEMAVTGRYVVEFSIGPSEGETLPDSIEDLEDADGYRWQLAGIMFYFMESVAGIDDANLRNVVTAYNDMSWEDQHRFACDLDELMGRYRKATC